MNRHVFVLVPSARPTGPVKGAYALANALVRERPVTLVTLKPGPGADAVLDSRVGRRSLVDVNGGWRSRVGAYRDMLRQAGGRDATASISMGFSADTVNRFCREAAVICASVRGNLLRNYRLDYGAPGILLAIGHLASLRSFDHVVAITPQMARQVEFYARQTPAVIGNFVDEAILEPYRRGACEDGPLRLVFVGSLTRRKQPLLAVRALQAARQRHVDATLDVIGTGPLAGEVTALVEQLGLSDVVALHGQLPDPYPLVARADVMILPSLSEGMARAALEALFLGVPCVLRNVDGNADLLAETDRGVLFDRDDELPHAVLTAAERSRMRRVRSVLLPACCRQQAASRQYLDLVERHD